MRLVVRLALIDGLCFSKISCKVAIRRNKSKVIKKIVWVWRVYVQTIALCVKLARPFSHVLPLVHQMLVM